MAEMKGNKNPKTFIEYQGTSNSQRWRTHTSQFKNLLQSYNNTGIRTDIQTSGIEFRA